MTKSTPARNSRASKTAVASEKTVPAPRLPYEPPKPKRLRPTIGLIGCGGITVQHLAAYKKMGWDVVALCDSDTDRAETKRKDFFPKAAVISDHRRLLERADINVVDIATHPAERLPLIRDALEADKDVLSQKPFVLDLDEGEALVELAKRKKRRVAVNQNGRWAPYLSYAREAATAGVLGEIQTVNISLNWNHTWIKGTPFERIHHIILYDFAIHWFDFVACLFGERNAASVFATTAHLRGQELRSPLAAHAIVDYGDGLASLAFNGHTLHTNEESLSIIGTEGAYSATGKVCDASRIALRTARGTSRPRLAGNWFPDGFAGSMGELLCAIEEDREPGNNAANNLRSLALCFAAIESTATGKPVTPGSVRQAGAGARPDTTA